MECCSFTRQATAIPAPLLSTTCTRKGCGKSFDPAHNEAADCFFHPGAPVFHEGLKGWSCCKKRETSFDDFLNIAGCTNGTHSSEKPEAPPKPEAAAPASTVKDAEGKEVYGAPAAAPVPLPLPSAPAPRPLTDVAKPVSTPYVEEQDDPAVTVEKGTACKRKACGQRYDGEAREGEECRYHAGAPIFHEGSKGYSCCKRRVLDFDEFLAIEGCRTGKHLFVGAKKEDKEELIECRVDHYQTPRQVIVSVFGKGADKEASVVKFEAEAMHVDLILPGRKRFTKSFNLYGPIDPEASKYSILGTKTEITLAKADGRSWSTIQALDPSLANNFTAQLAFSAGGGRGTTGAKEAVLDEQNRMRA